MTGSTLYPGRVLPVHVLVLDQLKLGSYDD